MGVSDDIGQLVLKVSDEALAHANPDSPKRDAIHNYFYAMDQILKEAELYAHDKLTVSSAKESFYEGLPRFQSALSDMISSAREQNQQTETMLKGVTKVFAIGTGTTGICTIGAIATKLYELHPAPTNNPETILYLGIGASALMGLITGITHTLRKHTARNAEIINSNNKKAYSSVPDNWFKAFEKHHDALRKKSTHYWLYSRNGR